MHRNKQTGIRPTRGNRVHDSVTMNQSRLRTITEVSYETGYLELEEDDDFDECGYVGYAELVNDFEEMRLSKPRSTVSSRPPQAVHRSQIPQKSSVIQSSTRQREVERVRLMQENERLRKARVEEIKNLIQRAQQLDIAFLVDATDSMQPSIQMVKNEISAMAAGISRSYPQSKLRFALATYRDYNDYEDYSDWCDFTSSYKGPNSVFSQVLSRIECRGGGDAAEDVFSGLEAVADLDWQSTNRLLVHIGDAPCHGWQYHDMGAAADNHHGGDKFGRNIHSILQELRQSCKITLYCFCHITNTTVKMVRKFRKAAGKGSWLKEWRLEDISKIPDKVVAVSRSTIADSLSVLQKGGNVNSIYVKEKVVAGMPSWSSTKAQEGVWYFHQEYSLSELLNSIQNTHPLKLKRMGNCQIWIAPHPFSGDGAVRWPYHALFVGREIAKTVVVKRFKLPFGKSPREVHARECYVNQMEVQTVAEQLAEEFNKSTANLRGVMKVQFTKIALLEVGGKVYTMEKFLEGEWVRYSNNGQYVNTADYAGTLQAFSHWTYHVSKGLLMVTDLQGVKVKDEKNPGKHVFLLCDPAIHTNDQHVLRFTNTNLGERGFKLFLDNHKCNSVCRHLGLPAGIAGHTDDGTQVEWADITILL